MLMEVWIVYANGNTEPGICIELSVPEMSSVSFKIFTALAESKLVYFINPSDKQKLLCHKVNFKETATRLIEQETSFT